MKTVSPRAHRRFFVLFFLASNAGTVILGMIILALQRATSLAHNWEFSAMVVGAIVAIVFVNASAVRSAVKGENEIQN